MACFRPNHIVSKVVDGVGVVSRFMGGAGLLHAEDLYYENPAEYHTLVPCGRCMGCRLDRARVWADRMLLELRDNDYKAIFVTLTYDNDHLPRAYERKAGYYPLSQASLSDQDDYAFCDYLSDGELWVADAAGLPLPPATLNVRDTQLFFKRLRKAFPGRRIRYFLAGEYGPKSNRPHYHAIIFGLTLADFDDCAILKYNDLGQLLFRSETFARVWGNGYCSLGVVNWNTCSYVARYTMKKVYRDDDPSAYADGRVPPFCTMSRCPGIGLLHAEDLLSKGDKTFVRDDNGVHEVYLGRPFIRSVLRTHINAALDDPSKRKKDLPIITRLLDVQSQRCINSITRSVSNLARSGQIVAEYYRSKEVYFLDRVKLLPERGDCNGKAQARASQGRQKGVYPYRC